MHFLAIDIGSSFVKSALLDLDSLSVCRVRKTPTPIIDSRDGETRELSVPAVAARIRTIIEDYDRLNPISGVVFSVQMHGAMFRDEADRPISNYITWQDKHTLHTDASGLNCAERAERLMGPDTLLSVGNRISPGHTAAHLLSWKERTGRMPARVSLLGDAVAEELCGAPCGIHETQACSAGLYDLYRRCWSRNALEALGCGSLRLPVICATGEPAGVYRCGEREIPLYAAIGDQQAAIMGAFLKRGELMVNIGTGAQVISMSDRNACKGCETRLLFEGDIFKTMTRLPGGRAFNVLIRFLQDVGARLFGCTDVSTELLWQRLIGIADSAAQDRPRVNMEFAERNGGSFFGINEDNLMVDRLIYAAFEDMVDHYQTAYKRMCGEVCDAEAVLVGGGLGRKVPQLGRMIGQKLALPVRYAPFAEDVLAGLTRVAAVCSGRYANLEETESLADKLRFEAD